MDIKDYLCATCDAKVIDKSSDAIKEFGTAYGADLTILDEAHINALKEGKMLAIDDGEYVHFVIFESAAKNEINK